MPFGVTQRVAQARDDEPRQRDRAHRRCRQRRDRRRLGNPDREGTGEAKFKPTERGWKIAQVMEIDYMGQLGSRYRPRRKFVPEFVSP